MEPNVDFTPLHAFMREHNAAGTFYIPADLETMYDEWAEADDNLPPYAEVRDSMLNSYYWQQAIADAMSQVVAEIMGDMINDVAAGYLTATEN